MSHLSIVALYGIFSSCVAFYWFSWDRSVALYWYRLLQKLCRLLLIFTCLGGILEVSPFIENITRPKTSQIVALSPCRGVAFYAGPQQFISVVKNGCEALSLLEPLPSICKSPHLHGQLLWGSHNDRRSTLTGHIPAFFLTSYQSHTLGQDSFFVL